MLNACKKLKRKNARRQSTHKYMYVYTCCQKTSLSIDMLWQEELIEKNMNSEPGERTGVGRAL